MSFLKALCLALLALAASTVSMADAVGPAVPGALAVIEGKLSQWPIPTPQRPRDPVADADGNIYFSLAGANRIGRFDPRTRQFMEWGLPEDSKPHGLAIARDGRVFFAGNGSGTLGELDTATGAVREHRTSSAESGPYSVALDSDGNVWLTERGTERLALLDRATGKVSEFRVGGSPYGLAFDRRGILWVSQLAADTLSSIDPRNGRTTALFLGSGAKPRRIGVAPDGMLWVSLYGTGKLAKVNPATNSVVKEYVMPGGANAGPYSVNVDARGRVWVAEFQSDSVVILDPQSEKFRVIRLPDRNSGIRSATLDAKGRYWYIAATTGMLGVIE